MADGVIGEGYMNTQLVCWKCGTPLSDDIPLPLARLAECLACRTELHVCYSCEYYDTRVAKQCRETIAEEVQDKLRANFCDYFQLRPNAYQPRDDSAQRAARSQLDVLFGTGKTESQGAVQTQQKTSEQHAQESLDALFSVPQKKDQK